MDHLVGDVSICVEEIFEDFRDGRLLWFLYHHEVVASVQTRRVPLEFDLGW